MLRNPVKCQTKNLEVEKKNDMHIFVKGQSPLKEQVMRKKILINMWKL